MPGEPPRFLLVHFAPVTGRIRMKRGVMFAVVPVHFNRASAVFQLLGRNGIRNAVACQRPASRKPGSIKLVSHPPTTLAATFASAAPQAPNLGTNHPASVNWMRIP